jgi:hypothetical protein
VVGFQPDVVSETLTYQPAVGHMLGSGEPPYAFDTITSCPTDFGVPCLRRRRWSRWMKGHGRGVLPGHALAPPAGHAPVNGGSAPVNGGGAPSDAPANGGSAPLDGLDGGSAPPTGSGPVDFSREHLTSLFARSTAVHCRVFLAASPVAVQAYYESLALGRGAWFASGEVRTSARAVLARTATRARAVLARTGASTIVDSLTIAAAVAVALAVSSQ